MTRHAAKRALIALSALAPLAGIGVVNADPGSECGYSDSRLCDPSRVYYCPSTGTFGSWLAACPDLVQGPYEPGGRRPDGGLAQ